MELVGYFQHPEELHCISTTLRTELDESPIADLLAHLEAHGDEATVAPLGTVPPLRRVQSTQRIERFTIAWFNSDQQFHVPLRKEHVSKLGCINGERRLRVSTWRGWLIIASLTRSEEELRQPW